MMLVDTHCHLDLCEFDQDRRLVMEKSRKLGVEAIVIPGIKKAGWQRLVELCAGESMLFPALGLHPYFVDHHQAQDVIALQHMIEQYRPIAVGEIGLDYYRPELDRRKQLALFETQLFVAKSVGLPVLLHNRKAHDQMLSMLRNANLTGGICHAFNGSFQQALQYIDLGFKLGFGGMLTFERSRKLRKLAASLPVESIVLETDAPDMPPIAHQYQRNSPEYLPEILAALSQVRNEPITQLAQQTTANALAVLAFSKLQANP